MSQLNETIIIRLAKEEDVALILDFIKRLAEYEKLAGEVVATEAVLYDSLFVKKAAEVLICEVDDKPAGFALFFHNFSTFIGKRGLYLEDLFVKPEMRGRGLGKLLLTALGKIANERDCGRMEWSCLDWNQPSIDFYRYIGAVPMDGWTVYRLEGDTLKTFGEDNPWKIEGLED